MNLEGSKEGPAMTIWIQNADWVVAWDDSTRGHGYLTGADVVFEDDRLAFVGRGYAGEADQVIDGKGLMVMPGLVDIHSHPGHEAYFSEEDKAFATPFGEPTYPDNAQIVISIYDRVVKQISAYAWEQDQEDFVEIALIKI